MIPLRKRNTHVIITLQPRISVRSGIMETIEDPCPVCQCDPCDCHGIDDDDEEYWKIIGDR